MKEEKVPFKTMEFSGVTFKVINRHEAQTIIGDLTDFNNQKIYNVFEDTWRFPDYEDNPIFLLAEEDIEMDSFEMDYSTEQHSDVFILGFIFKGNLTVNRFISSYDTDNSPALIVLGKTTTINITLFGSVHYLGGGLQCDMLIGEYNHGELFVKGEMTAWLIYADDMSMHFESFNNVQAVINAGRPDVLICSRLSDTDGSVVIIENYFPSTHKLSDIVNDSYINYDEANAEEGFNEDYYAPFKAGLSLIDQDKEERYNYVNFRNQLIEMIATLSEKEEMKEGGSLYFDDGSMKSSFVHFTYENQQYSQISTTITNGFNIMMRGIYCIDTQEITLVLEYLDEDETIKYQWMNSETAEGIEYYAIKHAVITAFETLNKDHEVSEEDNEEEYDDYEDDEEETLTLEEFSIQFGNYEIPDDLKKLFDFQSEYDGDFSECFYMHSIDKTGLKTWSEADTFYNSFIEFATANGSGSSYAYWLIDTDLNNCPIVVFGDEGGIHVIAENTRKLIHLLTYDTEISVDFDSAYFFKDEDYYEESSYKDEFQEWVTAQFGFQPIDSDEAADEIVNEAKEKYKNQLNNFLTEYSIEIGEDQE